MLLGPLNKNNQDPNIYYGTLGPLNRNSIGAQGYQGPIGFQGYQGFIGPVGAQGVQGSPGYRRNKMRSKKIGSILLKILDYEQKEYKYLLDIIKSQL